MRINVIKQSLLNLVLTIFILVFGTACEEKDPPEPVKQGLKITFSHKVDGNDLRVNQLIYINAAGNPYEVTEVM